MNSQVLIELLRDIRIILQHTKYKTESVEASRVDALRRIDYALATPAPIPDAGDEVEVAAYLNEWMTRDGGGMRVRPALSRSSEEWLKREYGPSAKVVKSEPLMTVAQHNRIVSALQDSAVVPDGWKLVPVEPTEDMQAAGQASGKNCAFSYAACYRAMLAASSAHGDSQ